MRPGAPGEPVVIWIGVKYSDGTRVYHIFRHAWLYVVGGKQHVNGRSLCRREFSDDRSGARVDVILSLVCGVEADAQDAPTDPCEECREEYRRERALKERSTVDISPP